MDGFVTGYYGRERCSDTIESVSMEYGVWKLSFGTRWLVCCGRYGMRSCVCTYHLICFETRRANQFYVSDFCFAWMT